MSWDTIIVGSLSLIGTIIGAYSGSKLTVYRIEQLEKKVDKHNNFAQRMPVVEHEIESIEHRLDHLEEG